MTFITFGNPLESSYTTNLIKSLISESLTQNAAPVARTLFAIFNFALLKSAFLISFFPLSLSGCECIIFSSTFAKEYGTFTSPDYPKSYQNNINCLLYTFIASRDEIVELTFQDFDIQKSHL
ncbi:hypothetical protein RUM43_002266, partial [Polyplax serrata]